MMQKMKSLKKLNLSLSLVLLLTFIVSINAQEDSPSVPMKVADEFKNNYDFDYALEWYEQAIQNFPDTLEAGNASLNKLAILYSQSNWYTRLSLEFLQLVNVQYDKASKYGCRGTMWKKYGAFLEKKKTYERLRLQKGKALKEELYRFEKNYAAKIDRLSIPHINEYTATMSSLTSMEEANIERLLVLGKDSHLEYESRRKRDLTSNFGIFCLQYMTLGGELPTKEDTAAYHNKEYAEREIDFIGFYYCLGLGLENGYQFQSAHEVFAKVVKLAKDDTHNKLVYETENRIKSLEDISSKNIDSLKKFLSPDEIDKYVEPYTGDSAKISHGK